MKFVPEFIKATYIHLFFKRLCYKLFTIYCTITGKRLSEVPTQHQIRGSNSKYREESEKYLTYSQELCGLQPNNTVLEVGCGMGSMAIPLTNFLNEKGSYEGLDIAKSDIDWFNKNIASKHPNFHFSHSGINNHQKNSVGKKDAQNFILPYEDAKFDFVSLTSLFTRTMPAEVEHYIYETSRIMKPGATSLISLFIVNCESEDLMIKKPTQMNFPYNKGFYRLHSLQDENKQVAYDEEWLLEKLAAAGLKMEYIKYGNWCGRDSYFDYQDILICSKVG